MAGITLQPEIEAVARERLGFEKLRSGQERAVRSILEGHDTLVVQPTGSGKSAIYQIAGLMIEGSTVVVSPLIALQKDQVDSIQNQNSADALAVNSTQRVSEFRKALDLVGGGEIEYIFLAPEQLHKAETLERLQSAGISLFVVDEAHCISHWGHDFRPDYRRLGHVIELLGHPRVLALTATASHSVREEIVARLEMRHPKIFVHGYNRPNIHLRVDHFKSEAEKRDALIHRVLWADKPGIVYVATRKAAEEIMRALSEGGAEALFYHGGLSGKERDRIHERFMSGDAEVIVATNAFGMGIDKPDIRFVFHHDVPESLDSYYQEIGRAGRDGKQSEAVLFYRRENIGAQGFKTGEGKIEPELLERLASRIAEENAPVHPDRIGNDTGLSQRKLSVAVRLLEDAGAVETLSNGQVLAVANVDSGESAREASDEQERRSQAKRDRLEKMRDYAEAVVCRRELLLQYLGDDFTGPCGSCDVCEIYSGRPAPDLGAGTRREVI